MRRKEIIKGDFKWGLDKEVDLIRTMSKKDLSNSISRILKGHYLENGVWVFGYGSLMWNPDFDVKEKISGEVKGYQRSLCLKSMLYRGSPDYYGLVFGLDYGDSCQGMCFRIAPENLKKELLKLWEREMFAENYIPTWIKVKTKESNISALTFLINNKHENYVPNLGIEDIAQRVTKAKGKCGSCIDYVMNTIKHLHQSGLRDKYLEKLIKYIDSQKFSIYSK
tara:strand:- start:3716 stop:4384 length:669 start_codon:yes stop_codon:yes gene_type:complete